MHPMPDADHAQTVMETARRNAAGLRRMLAWQGVRLGFRLAFLGFAAAVLGGVIMGAPAGGWMFAAVPVCLAAATLAGLVAERTVVAEEMKVAAAIRRFAVERLARKPARRLQALPAGQTIVGLQRHPEAVAALVLGHRAATLMLMLGPLASAAALAVASWEAALVVLGLTPVMIVFFVLVGDIVRRRAAAQEAAFGRLASQFADRIRTLPTILANHALASEEEKLRDRLEAYARNTVGVLRIAFLNAAIIDFFSSLSIALLAILLGLGHLKLLSLPGFSGLDLWQSLFILMIAPDYFAPYRRYAEQYHVKAEGVAAAAALDLMLAPYNSVDPIPVDVTGLAGDLPGHGLIAVTGPSGSGKSTLLRGLAGVDDDAGRRAVRLEAPVLWISADAHVVGGTLRDAIGRGIPPTSDETLRQAACRVGLLDDAALPAGLATPVGLGGAELSGGQRMRIALVRALLGEGTVIADEPTAKLDAGTAAMVRQALRDMATTRLVIAATHDAALTQMADRVVDLAGAAREAEVMA